MDVFADSEPLRFESFELDVRSPELRMGSTSIRLQEQPYHAAMAHVGLGEIDAAFAALERATVDADPALAAVAVEPRVAPLRTDPRYARLVELLGLV